MTGSRSFSISRAARRQLPPAPVTLTALTASISFRHSPGLGAPHWDEHARGLICGLTRGTTAAHVALATVHSIAYQVRDVFEAMRRDAATPIPELLADGGASGNEALMQFQSDILGVPVIRNRSTDVSAIGAAWLAGLGVGVWTSTSQLERLPRATDRFEPRMSEEYARAALHGLDRCSRTVRHEEPRAHVARGRGGQWRASMNCG